MDLQGLVWKMVEKSKSLLARFRFTAAVWLGTSLFWVVKQRYFVFIYQHFGTEYPSHLLQSCSPRRFLLAPLQDGTDRLLNTLRTGDADLRFYITTVQDG